MQQFQSMNGKRIAAGIMGIMVLLVVLFSAYFVALEAHHDCCGEDCPICATMALCENALHQLGNGLIILASAVLPILFSYVSKVLFSSGVVLATPVSIKVRLNN